MIYSHKPDVFEPSEARLCRLVEDTLASEGSVIVQVRESTRRQSSGEYLHSLVYLLNGEPCFPHAVPTDDQEPLDHNYTRSLQSYLEKHLTGVKVLELPGNQNSFVVRRSRKGRHVRRKPRVALPV